VLDQGVPRETAGLLRTLGCECVGEIEMSGATDYEILAFAAGKDSVIVTLDAVFHTILAVAGSDRPSVVRVRIQGLRAPATSRLIQNVLVEWRHGNRSARHTQQPGRAKARGLGRTDESTHAFPSTCGGRKLAGLVEIVDSLRMARPREVIRHN
jgi:predicted nuclease of predicted toxin-antitoxin system